MRATSLSMMLAGFLMLAGQASADSIPATIATFAKPHWIRVPTGDEISRAYPPAAFRKQIPGAAVMNCTVTADGTLSGCKVSREVPADMMFGEAALKLADKFQMDRQTDDGRSVEGGEIAIPVRFAVP